MKRQTNTTAIKVKFLPCTNTKPDRLRITQTNFNKSVIINGAENMTTIDFISSVLEGIEKVKSFSLIVDNTQEPCYLFSVDFKDNTFTNILNNFK